MMVNLIDAFRPINAARDALGESSRQGLDEIASDPSINVGADARLGATLLSADSPGDVVAGGRQTLLEAAEGAEGLARYLPYAAGVIVVSVVAYAIGQLFTFSVDL
jgi:hypothetical protein